jgi:protein-tyrosine kinase
MSMNLIQQAEQRRAELSRKGELRPVPTGVEPPPAAEAAPERTSPRVVIDLDRLNRAGYLTPGDVQSRIADDFRQLRRALISNVHNPADPARPRHEALVMVTSALPGEGKTFCSVNLAISIAMGVDTSVLLVDGDVLKPSVMTRLGLPPAKGLLDLLAKPGLDPADLILATNIPKMSLLAAGTPTHRASELLESAALDQLLHDLATRFPDRLIVLDAPPLLLTTVAPALAQRMGQVVMVVEAARTARSAVAQAFSAVESCPVVLTILNNCSPRMAARGYGYYGAYGQYGRDLPADGTA